MCLWRSISFFKLIGRLRQDRRREKFHPRRLEFLGRRFDRSHRHGGFQFLPFREEFADILPILTMLLSLCLIDRLEADRTVFALRHLVERCGNYELLFFEVALLVICDCWAAQVRGDRALG